MTPTTCKPVSFVGHPAHAEESRDSSRGEVTIKTGSQVAGRVRHLPVAPLRTPQKCVPLPGRVPRAGHPFQPTGLLPGFCHQRPRVKRPRAGEV